MVNLLFSYSHKDEALRNELEEHLALLKRQGAISSWHDRRIGAGSEIDKAISSELESAQIILLLVSAHFLNSDYCFEQEMQRALQRQEEGSAVVIPVILHPCDWHSAPFGKLRATPADGKPVSMFANQHEAFMEVAKDVRKAAEDFFDEQAEGRSEIPELPGLPLVSGGGRSSNLRVKRKFDDHERDGFLENSYEYIARYFDGSLEELGGRNPQIKTRFKRLTATSFEASIYDGGRKVAQCSIWLNDSRTFGLAGIAFSNSGSSSGGGFNESLSVSDDGYTLHLKSLGMLHMLSGSDTALTQEGAAEQYWSAFIRPLQE